MKVEDIVKELKLEVFGGTEGLNREITGGYSSDLMSDVLAHGQKGHVWLTLHNHKNTVAIASLKELAAIIMVRGIKPSEDTVKQGEAEGIPVLGTFMNTFEMSGLFYNLLQKK